MKITAVIFTLLIAIALFIIGAIGIRMYARNVIGDIAAEAKKAEDDENGKIPNWLKTAESELDLMNSEPPNCYSFQDSVKTVFLLGSGMKKLNDGHVVKWKVHSSHQEARVHGAGTDITKVIIPYFWYETRFIKRKYIGDITIFKSDDGITWINNAHPCMGFEMPGPPDVVFKSLENFRDICNKQMRLTSH